MARANFGQLKKFLNGTLREMNNFVEFTGPWYSMTLGAS